MLEHHLTQRTSSSVSLMSHPITCSYVLAYTYKYVRRWAFRYCREVLLEGHRSGKSTRNATVYPSTLPFVKNRPHHQNIMMIVQGNISNKIILYILRSNWFFKTGSMCRVLTGASFSKIWCKICKWTLH